MTLAQYYHGRHIHTHVRGRHVRQALLDLLRMLIGRSTLVCSFEESAMEDSEKQPLLEEVKDGKPKDSGCPEMAESGKIWRKFRVFIVIGTVIAVFTTIAAVGGTSAFAAKFALYTNSECPQEGTFSSLEDVHSRSGSYSLLDSILYQDLICYTKPQIQLSLESRNSLVGVYQTLCQNIETQSFQVNYQLNDLPSDDGPRPVFDENFTPQNYFMDGTIQVEMVNITTMSSTVSIELCLFSTNYKYNDF